MKGKSRKILWGRSGNRCAICRNELLIEATSSDDESVIGDECHIISGNPGGPRHVSDFPLDRLDEPENMVLLCRVHHKNVDDQPNTYTVDRLRSIKVDHETWVSSTLSDKSQMSPIRIRRIKGGAPSYLTRLLAGSDLFRILDGAHAYSFDNDEPKSQLEVDLLSGFFQEAQDYGEISTDLNAGDRIQTSFRLSESINQLEEAGFWAFGGIETRIVEGGVGAPAPFPIAVIRVLRKDSTEIVKSDLGGATSKK